MVKKTPYITVHQVPLWSKYDRVELICVELGDNTDSLPLWLLLLLSYRVIVVYRPPDYNTDDNTLLFSALNDLADNCARLSFWEISTCQISTGTYLCIPETTCIQLLLTLFVKMD